MKILARSTLLTSLLLAGLLILGVRSTAAQQTPKTSAVLYHPMFEDAQGKKYRPLEAIRELTEISPVPVINGFDQFIATGIVGGNMYSIDQQARDVVQTSWVLRGEAISSILNAKDQSNRYIFDHLVLQRFGIPLSLLPLNSIVKTHQYSFRELYQPQIIAANTGIVILLLLVIFLLVVMARQLNRTRLALADLNNNLEIQVQERTAMLNLTNAQLQDEIAGHRLAEEQLRESEEKYRGLLDSQEGSIMIFDFDGVYHYMNQPSVNSIATSGSAQDIIGKRLHDLFPKSTADWQLEQIRQVFTTGQGFAGEFADTLDNEYSWWHLNFQPIRDASGNVAQVMVNALNITERKRMEDALRESEARTTTIFRLSPVVIGVSTVAEGRYTDVNDAFEHVLGYSQAEVIGQTSFDLNLWEDSTARSRILSETQVKGRVENLEIRLRRKSGEIFPALVFITPIELHDEPCLLTMMMDITERKHVEEQFRETRDALQTIIHSSPLAILTLDAEDRVVMWNPAAEVMFGWSDQQVLGHANPTVPENKAKEYEALRQATLSGMAFSNVDTMRVRKDGTQFPVSLSVAPLRGEQMQVVGRLHILTDITERKKLQEELRQQATTDELTKISNRRHFMDLANSEIKRAIRLKRPPAIALIDLDHFKQINDTFGHAVGDQALIRFANICQRNIREIDVFARFGGDEFILLLPETNQEQAYAVLERIRLALSEQPQNLNGMQVSMTISSGITSLAGDRKSYDTLLFEADQALYRAKEAGRNTIVRYNQL